MNFALSPATIRNLDRIRRLFAVLDTRRDLIRLLDPAHGADGVKIFIGAESAEFGIAGCAMVPAPIAGGETGFVGAIGVIGPSHLNYGRIIPMVDYRPRRSVVCWDNFSSGERKRA